MLTLRQSQERGFADHGWLRSRHSFSFADYYDPRFMGWGNLRVINEDWIAPQTGFGLHGHADMEILTYMLEGTLTHQDSMGNQAAIRAGEVQRMSAGRGVRHSEFNHESAASAHLLQIWITPRARGIDPSYEQTMLTPNAEGLRLVAAPPGEGASVHLNADARLWDARLNAGQEARLTLAAGRRGYVHLIRGRLRVNGCALETGDAAALEQEVSVVLDQAQDAHVLVFDLQ